MPSVNDHLRVRFERCVRWVLEQYSSEGARALVNKARLAAAQLLMPPEVTPRSASSPAPASPVDRDDGGLPDVLTKLCGGAALRDLNLVDSLLAELEAMEASESDPDALARLYQLDHVAARLRRNAENLRILAGHEAGSAAQVASALVDVIRAAMSSIEQYPRIEIGPVVALAVVSSAADDLSRLLAELMDNATLSSPPISKVVVSAHLTEQRGIVLRIVDAGIGLPTDRMETLNAQLSANLRLDSTSVEHMGLEVVRRLAGKHGIGVRLESRATHGTTAAVLLPANLVCEVPATPWFADPQTMNVPRPRPAPSPVRAGASPQPSLPQSSERGERRRMPPIPRTTRHGLPRRIPQSMREFAGFAAGPDELGSHPSGEREQLMTDLGDFSAGEQAARQDAEGPHE